MRGGAGLTLIEISLSIVVATTVLLGAARAFSASLSAVGQAKDTTDAALFLESVLEDIAAQPYDNLLPLNGDRVFNRTDADDSRFAVDVTVFPSAIDLLQLRAVVSDLRTNREVGRVTTFRCRR